MTIPISILIPTRNEAANLARCLEPLVGWADEIVVVDSASTDDTIALAKRAGATVLEFRYSGGWPKKRQWALDTHAWRNEWVLLLDADEILDMAAKEAIVRAIELPNINGFWLRFQIVFQGRMLRHGDTTLWKLSLFRRGKGRYEKRLATQDATMSDVEVHEHVIVEDPVERIRCPIRHENVNSLFRYIEKHNEYSNWEARVFLDGQATELEPRFFGTQAQRRRWLKRKLLMCPGSPLMRFLFLYVLRLGFLDGQAGLTYALFKLIQTIHVKAKIRELRLAANREPAESQSSTRTAQVYAPDHPILPNR